MLIGTTFEKTSAVYAWELCADKLADWVRNCWQENTAQKRTQWEEAEIEDPAAIPGMREEGFAGLVGIDYIFKWWGAEVDDKLAGVLEVIWKIKRENNDSIDCYKTWIRLADRDFILGLQSSEPAKREVNRAEFRKAFSQWLSQYPSA